MPYIARTSHDVSGPDPVRTGDVRDLDPSHPLVRAGIFVPADPVDEIPDYIRATITPRGGSWWNVEGHDKAVQGFRAAVSVATEIHGD